MISLPALCLALTVYFEARGEPQMGKKYVAHVVMNRAEDDYEDSQNSICAAVFDPEQFSWTNSIKRSTSLRKMTMRAINRVNEVDSWDESVAIAEKVMHRKRDITDGAKYFNRVEKGVRYKTNVRPKRIGHQLYY